MSPQIEQRYTVRLVTQAAGLDPFDAVRRALEGVPADAWGRFIVSAEEACDQAPPGAPTDPSGVRGLPWGRHCHRDDLRYHGGFLGAGSGEVVCGSDRDDGARARIRERVRGAEA